MQKRKSNIRGLTHTALFAAILCFFSPFTVYIGQIPATLATFAVLLSGIVLGAKRGAAAVLVYILLGACGLPVFSGALGGTGVLFGPTGGYLWAYPIMAMLASVNLKSKKVKKTVFSFLMCVLANVVCCFFGTAWFMYITQKSVFEALAICVYPFIAFDLLKSVCAAFLGNIILQKLKLVI